MSLNKNIIPIGSLRESRAVKKQAQQEGISLKGQAGKQLEGIFLSADEVAAMLETVNKSWIDEKLRSVKILLEGVSFSDLRTAFYEGFHTFIKQYYRLFKREGGVSAVAQLTDTQFLSDIISAYTIDFISSLRKSQQLGISTQQALELARLSYRFNPDIIIKLQEQFPDMDPSVINRAAVNYPSNPAAFLEFIRNGTTAILETYQKLSAKEIHRAFIHNPNDPLRYLKLRGFLSVTDETTIS